MGREEDPEIAGSRTRHCSAPRSWICLPNSQRTGKSSGGGVGGVGRPFSHSPWGHISTQGRRLLEKCPRRPTPTHDDSMCGTGRPEGSQEMEERKWEGRTVDCCVSTVTRLLMSLHVSISLADLGDVGFLKQREISFTKAAREMLAGPCTGLRVAVEAGVVRPRLPLRWETRL